MYCRLRLFTFYSLVILVSLVCRSSGHRDGIPDSDSDESQENQVGKRRQGGVFARQWEYEGMPSRRALSEYVAEKTQGPETTTTSTTTTTPSTTTTPDKRYRRVFNADETASIDQHPYLAAVLVNRQLWCAGVIISSDTVLTAAHCLQLQYNNRFFREYVKMLTIRFGSSNATAGGEVVKVTDIFFHPNYKPQTLSFNVAVLKTHKNMTFADRLNVTKLRYPHEMHITADKTISFLGWGSVWPEGGHGGKVLLQKVDLPIYDLTDCQDIYGRNLVTKANFCAGYITVPKNVCNHDAGGPAMIDGSLAGILSFSNKRCDELDKPAVFTKISAVSTWLDTVVK